MKVKESLNVTFYETPPPPKTSPLEDDDLVKEEAIEVNKTRPLGNSLKDKSLENNEIINIKESKSHPLDNVIGNLNQRTLRSQAQDKSNFFCFLSTIESKNINEALKDESWVMAMQEELNQFISNDVWELVHTPMDMTIIGTKWVYRNKLDENGVVSRNKARLVAQGLFVSRKAILRKGISKIISATDNAMDGICGDINSPINNMHELKIGDEFLKILRDNAFNGMDGGDMIDHIARVVEITEWIKVPDIDKNRLRIHVFSKSLSNDAEKWWNDEIEGTTISWDELRDQFNNIPT
ncbi:retrovirus-related pol polyprotein from transposon TNT 1-94 [Tanacetum coccineum]